MEKFYQEEGILKNIYITETHVMASDEDYGSVGTFLSKVNQEKKGLLDTIHKYEYSQIERVNVIRENNVIQIYFNENGKTELSAFIFAEQKDFEDVLNFILSKCPKLRHTIEHVKTKSAIVKPVLYTFSAAALTVALVLIANDIEAGETVRVSGSKRGLKTIFLGIAETLGVWGCLVLGIVVTCGFVYYTYKTYQDSEFEREVYL
ncbi:MAG: hypothetical protein LBV72_09735 [Tannerella sp.]|jgi:hypothetical protein|nr:hypothetical protein [Tannerella sp.]